MSLIERLKRRIDQRLHSHMARAVLDTPPISPADDGLVLLSMIGTAVIVPYLVAIKSLHRQLGRGRVMLLDDGTLTAADRAILAHHLGDPKILSIAEVDTGPCPRGGTWERLLTILDLRAHDYVIQLDSDTLTLGAVPEVLEAIAQNRSFTLSGGEREAPLGFLPLPEFAALFYPKGERTGHIQIEIESRLLRLLAPEGRRYARGCSGFAGFSCGGPGREAAYSFSQDAEAIVEGRWREWGTEQVSSTYVIANEAGSTLLPYDRYFNYWNEPWGADMRFVHFVGTYRYANGAYRRATRQVLELLR